MRSLIHNLSAFFILSFALIGTNSAHGNTFSGYVYDNTTGDPIAGAEITVGNNYWPPTSAIYTSITSALGHYEVTGVPDADDYTVLASAIGYASEYEQMQQPPLVIDFYLDKPGSGCLVETINEGLKHYQFDGHFFYRTDGEIQEQESYFPDVDAQNSTITDFLEEIGAGTSSTTVDSEMWWRTSIVWGWLQNNAYMNVNDPVWQEAHSFMLSFTDGWYSIEAMAEKFKTYGFLPWGTCMSRAQIFTTLLYRAGISKDRVAIEEMRWKLRYSQHMATILYVANRWVYLDPTSISSDFPSFEEFHSIPQGDVGFKDYCHPLIVKIIPNTFEEQMRSTQSFELEIGIKNL